MCRNRNKIRTKLILAPGYTERLRVSSALWWVNDLVQPTFGICFDVDGVLARGAAAIPAAVTGFKRLIDDRRQPRVPVAFVTNSLSRNCDKAAHLSTILGVQVACFVHLQYPDVVDRLAALLGRYSQLRGTVKWVLAFRLSNNNKWRWWTWTVATIYRPTYMMMTEFTEVWLNTAKYRTTMAMSISKCPNPEP